MRKTFVLLCLAMMAIPAIASAQRDTVSYKSLSDSQLLSVACYYRSCADSIGRHAKAAWIFNYLAKNGNVTAMNELGCCFLEGDGVKQSFKTAFNLFRLASERGDINAKCNLAQMYQQGQMGSVNYRKAYVLYKEAADSGSVQGMYGAGYLLYKGFGVTQNYNEAIRLLEQGAEQGHAGCSKLLASYYANGYDGSQNLEKAKTYWRKASLKDSNKANNVTEDALFGSINRRKARRGTWKHIRNHVLQDETMPEISSTTEACYIEGSWTGKLYTYDWSRRNIMSEDDVRIDIASDGDSVRVECYMGDSLATAYTAGLKDGKYDSHCLTAEQKKYDWTVTKTAFDKRGDYLLADMRLLKFKNMSIQRPCLAVLSLTDGTENTTDASLFTINKVSCSNGNLSLDVSANESMDVDISITSAQGNGKVMSYRKYLHQGHNNFTISALQKKRDIAYIVTVTSKGERHSKTITVAGNE